jgi:hypothetical protein
MELVMNILYLATLVAAVICISIASHLFATAALGPMGFLAAAGLRVRRIAGAVGNLLNDWVAAMLARRERQAAMWLASNGRLR